jgi:hypothetical protein
VRSREILDKYINYFRSSTAIRNAANESPNLNMSLQLEAESKSKALRSLDSSKPNILPASSKMLSRLPKLSQPLAILK